MTIKKEIEELLNDKTIPEKENLNILINLLGEGLITDIMYDTMWDTIYNTEKEEELLEFRNFLQNLKKKYTKCQKKIKK